MSERYDIAIVGSGPAGIEAAINAKIRNKNIIVFGNKNFSPKLMKAPKVNNYLGFYNLTGKELKDKFKEHIDSMNIEIVEERIDSVYAMGEYFSLMVNNKMYEARSVIIATGIEYGKPLKGEEEFLGKGVGYCATCDAPLYKGKVVTIVGYNKEAEKEANYVSELASKVYYVPMNNGELSLNDNIEIVKGVPKEVVGEERVKQLVLNNNTIDTDGIFILKDSISPSQLVPGLQMEDDHIKVDRKMRTNIERCYAAGDCVGKPYQYIKSAGEGLIAALTAVEEL
ncbi:MULTISPECIES: NAD(P)/FAD-dependent oxidoreductase [Clostridium]|uniref:Thioredoxin reductase n=1 Tax=Clostridium novyi (strain NT) TaxID=386415 RepID=A0PXZ0_CLONN|nr:MULTISPECIES: NAD(P)/FAD-dependent oxidoreductase [Clostridium]ABK61038.1 thioredoxin reductase [Clostridium novyi NT]KEH87291.1 thioredoxin reductase [Clostridium novyi A str. NCTC 538]KEH90166.1 thioredoxin reductase [Clostridium novyi A str. 4540]KEH90766.1 thioredoxin reductase [Clostridium novyi A str. BKT29909]KEH93327.1 thioredoxin reductase [Clostridium botulinum C/D str. It1]